MTSPFDAIIDRRQSDSAKWSLYGDDVLPLWLADMDFVSPQPIIDAMRARVENGLFGYCFDLPELREAICARVEALYNWQVTPETVVLLPGLVTGLSLAARAIGERGDNVLVNTPVYPPFLTVPPCQERTVTWAPQVAECRDGVLRYAVDVAALEAAVTPATRLFILCNPHNPTGRAFAPAELDQMAELAARRDLVICSDEIHCDLLLDGVRHTPIASLAPEVAARTITLMAPSKSFNIPALGCSAAIIPDAELRKRFEAAGLGIVPHVNVLGLVAALAAYTECEGWLAELTAYLTANRNFLVDYIHQHLPQIRTTVPEATYLAWLDCREAGIEGNPYEFFVKEAKVALNDGERFGEGGEGFVRLNFGCPRATLLEALERMRAALEGV